MIGMQWPREQRDRIIEQIQHFFAEERSEDLGSIAAEQILMFMMEAVGPHIYNQALKDARVVLNERLLTLEDELYSLEKPIS